MEASDVPPVLHQRLGHEATVGLLELFETARQEWIPDVTTAAVERFERRLGEETGSLRTEIAALRLEMHDGFATLRQELQAGDSSLRQELQEGFAAVRQEMAAGLASVRQEMAAGLASVRQEMAAGLASVRQEMAAGLASVRQEMAAGLASVRQEMFTGFTSIRQENANARVELLKWCFVFWVGQVFAVAGVVALVIRLMQS